MNLTNEDNIDLMSRYPDGHFDLAIVDPPYGIGTDWTKDVKSTHYKHRGNYKNDTVPSKEYFYQLFRVSKNQIIWGANYFIGPGFMPNNNNWIVWKKNVDWTTQHHSEGELAWHSFPIPLRIVELWWNGAVKCEVVTKIHPHQKPVKLYEWCLSNYAKKGDKILDTHLGSGSIAIAVDRMNKIEGMDLRLTACELEKSYFDNAVKRIKRETSQTMMTL